MTRRWSRVAVPALALALVAEVGLAGRTAVVRTAGHPAVLTRPTVTGSAQPRADAAGLAAAGRQAAVQGLLERRAAAVTSHDAAALLADVDPQAAADFRTQQARLAPALAGVPLLRWTYRLDPTVVQPTRPGVLTRYGSAPVWVPGLTVVYQLAGGDAAPVASPQELTFVQRAGRWYVGSDSDGGGTGGVGTARAPWDFGPVLAVRSGRVLVLGHPGQAPSLRAVAADADRAVPKVTAVWGTGWSQTAVVLAPATGEEFSAIVGPGTDYAQIAAVATAELPAAAGSGASPVGDRVVVNPTNLARLSPTGREVVLTHELTHVASRLTTGQATPSWLVEGLADYTGYRDAGLPVRTVAAELAADLRAGGARAALTALPSDGDFATVDPDLPAVYERAWLACRLVAQRYGQQSLVALYRAVGALPPGSSAADVDAAVRRVLGVSTAELTAVWAADVRAQLA